MQISKVAASVALLLSGWTLFEAGRSSQTLWRPEIRHRSTADELRQLQAQPEQALVLWLPSHLDDERADLTPIELAPLRKARAGRVNKPSEDAASAQGLAAKD
jgi:hypothetical protein